MGIGVLLCLEMGNPGDGVWMLVLSMIVYGVAFDFFQYFRLSFVESETDSSIRLSAQGVYDHDQWFRSFIGSYVAGWGCRYGRLAYFLVLFLLVIRWW